MTTTQETKTQENLLSEPVYTVAEIALQQKKHPLTIRKLFSDEPGVLRYGHSARGKMRQYYTLRIPRHVVERVFARLTVGDRSAELR
jgi:hypothetical protein